MVWGCPMIGRWDRSVATLAQVSGSCCRTPGHGGQSSPAASRKKPHLAPFGSRSAGRGHRPNSPQQAHRVLCQASPSRPPGHPRCGTFKTPNGNRFGGAGWNDPYIRKVAFGVHQTPICIGLRWGGNWKMHGCAAGFTLEGKLKSAMPQTPF